MIKLETINHTEIIGRIKTINMTILHPQRETINKKLNIYTFTFPAVINPR